MIKRGESLPKAIVNAGKQTIQDVEDFGIFVADRTPAGRMIRHGENYLDALGNAAGQLGEDIIGK